MGQVSFAPTHDWQDVPAGAILPAGCQIRLDMQSGRQQARLAPNSEADALDGLDDDYAADAGHSAEPFDAEAMDLRALEGHEPPDREWTWDGWVPHGRACYLNGPGGAGKTLVSQMLGTAVALGRDLFGIVTRKAPVVGVWGEDDHDEIWRRQIAINRRFNCSMSELAESGVCWIPTARDITMFTAGVESDFKITEEFDRLREMIARRKPGLAIVDGVTLVYEGPEGKRALVTRVMRAFDEVARTCGCSILVIGHNNKAGEFSGSTAFENAVRARMSLERIETADGEEAVRLSLPKANYNGRDHIDLQFHHGVFVAIDEQHITGADRLERDMRRSQAEARFMEGVDKLTALERTLSASRQAVNYAPKLIRAEHAPTFTVKELEAAMLRLLEEGRLVPSTKLPFKKAGRRFAEGLGRPVAPADAPEEDIADAA